MATEIKWNPHRGTYYVQYWDGGWRRKTVTRKRAGWNPGDPPPKKIPPEAIVAHADILKLEEIARSRSINRSMLPGTLREFLLAHIETYRDPTKKSVANVVANFLEWCGSRRIDRVEKVTAAACGQWFEDRGRFVEPSTLKRERAQLARAWSKAARRKLIADNPWTVIDPPRLVPKEKGAWTREQFKALLSRCNPWLVDLLVVGVNTGFRISALLNLMWDQVEWNRTKRQGYGFIKVTAERDKAKKGYRIPISRECYDVLSRRRFTSDAVYCLTGHYGRRILRSGTVAKGIERACRRAKLRRPDSPNHHMRRTFGRWAVLGYLTGEPVPLTTLSGWMGHASVKTTMIYLDVSDDDSTRYMLGSEYKSPEATDPS